MWILQPTDNNPLQSFLLHKCNYEYSIGRKDCDILIDNKSISRKHCTIKLPPQTNSLVIQDFSKFGTFIKREKEREKERIVDGIRIDLPPPVSNNQLLIWFGPQSLPFTLMQLNFSFSFSGIPTDLKKSYASLCFESLGIEVVNQWSNCCTHLLMKTISLSEKVILALLDCKPIISINWITEINSTNLSINNSLLNWNEKWLPELDELLSSSFITKNLFLPNPKRSKIFTNFVFLFFDSLREEKMNRIIQYANGISLLIGRENLSEINSNSRIIFIGTENSMKNWNDTNPSRPISIENVNLEQLISMSIILIDCSIFNSISKQEFIRWRNNNNNKNNSLQLDTGKSIGVDTVTQSVSFDDNSQNLVHSQQPAVISLSSCNSHSQPTNSILLSTKRFKKNTVVQKTISIPMNNITNSVTEEKTLDDWLHDSNSSSCPT